MGSHGRIRVHVPTAPPDLSFAHKEAARPWTNFEQRDNRFIPLPRDDEDDLVDGTLRLEDKGKRFAVHQIDVDGSALKTIDFAANVRRIAAHLGSTERSMSEDAASLPALRTGGFVVTRDDRARQLVGHIDDGVAHEADHTADTPADLFAQDVTRGYRPDVKDDSGKWHTLVAREGSYTVERPGGPVPVPVRPDEGFVKGASSTSVPGETDADLYLHEAVFGWDGWSLAAKRPGQSIVDNAGDDVGTVDPKPPSDFPLVTQFQPTPGSLPRLRFGRTYRFRPGPSTWPATASPRTTWSRPTRPTPSCSSASTRSPRPRSCPGAGTPRASRSTGWSSAAPWASSPARTWRWPGSSGWRGTPTPPPPTSTSPSGTWPPRSRRCSWPSGTPCSTWPSG